MIKVLVLGALEQEVAAYEGHFRAHRFDNARVCIAATGVGKTAAAAMTQKMINLYSLDAIIFTGMGGALEEGLSVGDMGVGVAAIDEEMDARMLNSTYSRGQIPFAEPGLPDRVFYSDERLVKLALEMPRTFPAYLATGSRFLNAQAKQLFNKHRHELEADIRGFGVMQPHIYDMESVAVLQVANRGGIPALVVRTVSDSLRGNASEEFSAMMNATIDNYVELVHRVINRLS